MPLRLVQNILLIAFVFIVAYSSHSKGIHYLSGNYIGLWTQTVWKYSFINHHNCNFSTRLHLGNSSTDCVYWIRSDTVFVKALPSKQQQDRSESFLDWKDTLFISNDSCLLDGNRRYRYCIQASDTLYSQD
jgi:hypothetical protein